MVALKTKDRDILDNFKVGTKVPDWYLNGSYEKPKEIYYIKVPNLSSWHNFMLTAKIDSNSDDSQKNEGCSRKNSWSGAKDWNDYVDILDNGDNEVVKLIKTDLKVAVDDLHKRHEKVIKAYKFDVTGEQFDIGLVLSGVPEAWLEPIIEEEEVNQVTIKIDLTFNSGVKNRDIVKNASKLLAIATVLEELGVQVRVECYNFPIEYDSSARNRVIIIENVLKDYDEPINYRKLSSYLTTAQFRRGGLRMIEQMAGQSVAGGYGYQDHCEGVIRIDDEKAIEQFEREVFKDEK